MYSITCNIGDRFPLHQMLWGWLTKTCVLVWNTDIDEDALMWLCESTGELRATKADLVFDLSNCLTPQFSIHSLQSFLMCFSNTFITFIMVLEFFIAFTGTLESIFPQKISVHFYCLW